MKKFLLASSISMISLVAFAEPIQVQQIPANQVYSEQHAPASVYQKQTVVRYNLPTCKNCQTTTTVSRVVSGTEPVIAPAPCATGTCNNTCTTCGAAPVVAPVVPVAVAPQPKSCVFDNHKYAIANPLFVLREGQFSSDTVAGYFVQPKDMTFVGYNPSTDENDYTGRYRFNQWNVAEQIMYGITDWLSFKIQGGYQANRPKKSTWDLANNGHRPVPHNYSYDGTVGLQAHAIDTCNFDLIVGVDATWGKTGYKQGDCKDSENYKLITPYAIVGGQITKYVTPYLQAGYTFAVDTKKEVADDTYALQPGFYIQPSKYFAIHPYITKVEHQKPEWNLALDFYPYQNLVFGIEGSAVSWDKNPMGLYGISGRMKMTF